MTTDQIKSLFTRANQFTITKYGNAPDRLEITEDGIICARWINYHCGEIEEDTEDISCEDLTEDLEKIAEERKRKEEEDRIKRENYENEQKIIRQQREKEERKREYEKLRKEFE